MIYPDTMIVHKQQQYQRNHVRPCYIIAQACSAISLSNVFYSDIFHLSALTAVQDKQILVPPAI
jgi:hypothetical protein